MNCAERRSRCEVLCKSTINDLIEEGIACACDAEGNRIYRAADEFLTNMHGEYAYVQ